MSKFYFVLVCAFFLLSCKQHKRPEILKLKKVIYIHQIGDVNKEYISIAKTTLEKYYGFNCEIGQRYDFSDDLLCKSQKRYDAEKILNKFKSTPELSNNLHNIFLICEKDIAAVKGDIPEWGYIGLSDPQNLDCVVSTFRIKNCTQEIFRKRLEKITIHEIGHNLGLNHCEGLEICAMKDLYGKVKTLDDQQFGFCKSCKITLDSNINDRYY